MKISSIIIGIILFLTTTAAWTIPSSINRDISINMGSRGKTKWIRKKAWLESRGIDPFTGKPLASDNDDDGDEVSPYTVIGGGRIGSLLSQVYPSSCLLLGRGDSIPSDTESEGTPIYIATRNDSLDSIVDECPDNRKSDLVFLQNGYLDGFLESKGLMENTQALLYLSVPKLGVEPVDGITERNPEGLTAVTGVHGEAFAKLLGGVGLKCNVVEMEDYRPAMFEKLIWISTYMLVGTAKKCQSVGEAGSEHKDLVESVINELMAAVSEKEGITFEDGTVERLASYTDVVTDFPCGVKEFEWRNQYFYDLGDEACGIHNGLLRECKEMGLIGFDLP